MLLLDHERLPWSRGCHGLAGGEQFAAMMPEELLRLQGRAATTDGNPRQEAIRSRVASILPLYRLSRYRPTPPPTTGDPADRPTRTPRAKRTAPTTPPSTDAQSTITHAVPSPNHADDSPAAAGGDLYAADSIVHLPDVAWISSRDSTRAAGDLEDQAARHHLARHELTINADFRAIKDLTAHWRGRYQGAPGAHAVIEAHVREWCEQVLVELVLAARNSTWSQDQLDALLSPTSFTAVLLPRHLLHAMLQKRRPRNSAHPGQEQVGKARARPACCTPARSGRSR